MALRPSTLRTAWERITSEWYAEDNTQLYMWPTYFAKVSCVVDVRGNIRIEKSDKLTHEGKKRSWCLELTIKLNHGWRESFGDVINGGWDSARSLTTSERHERMNNNNSYDARNMFCRLVSTYRETLLQDLTQKEATLHMRLALKKGAQETRMHENSTYGDSEGKSVGETVG